MVVCYTWYATNYGFIASEQLYKGYKKKAGWQFIFPFFEKYALIRQGLVWIWSITFMKSINAYFWKKNSV